MNNIVATLRGKMERRDGWNTSTTRRKLNKTWTNPSREHKHKNTQINYEYSTNDYLQIVIVITSSKMKVKKDISDVLVILRSFCTNFRSFVT